MAPAPRNGCSRSGGRAPGACRQAAPYIGAGPRGARQRLGAEALPQGIPASPRGGVSAMVSRGGGTSPLLRPRVGRGRGAARPGRGGGTWDRAVGASRPVWGLPGRAELGNPPLSGGRVGAPVGMLWLAAPVVAEPCSKEQNHAWPKGTRSGVERVYSTRTGQAAPVLRQR